MASPFEVDRDAFRRLVEEIVPLNRFLGLKLASFDAAAQTVTTRLELRPHYVGNPVRGMPHGGIIAFVVDASAGCAAALSLDDLQHVDKVATVDMRVDYLKASRGTSLIATAQVVRPGNRVVMVRTDVYDDMGEMIAAGSNVFHIVR